MTNKNELNSRGNFTQDSEIGCMEKESKKKKEWIYVYI